MISSSLRRRNRIRRIHSRIRHGICDRSRIRARSVCIRTW
jgi:hypothetical protein